MPPAANVASRAADKKGHVCPPSNATHPKDRWETAFVYSYICKFTQLKARVDGFNSVMELVALYLDFCPFVMLTDKSPFWIIETSLEDALLTPQGQTNILLQEVLTRFILILRPQSRNIAYVLITGFSTFHLMSCPENPAQGN
jgi:hypothetical protein